MSLEWIPKLLNITKYRDTGKLSRGLKFSFQPESELLIIKMPSGAHEIPHLILVEDFLIAFRALGISRSGYSWIGGSRYQGRGPASPRSKEGDQAFLPAGRTYLANFPSVVVEVGVSESMPMLRRDAAFWLTHSANECRLVVIISVNRSSRYMVYELWSLGSVPGLITRANPNPAPHIEPIRPQQTVIQSGGATIGPPDLQFTLTVLFDNNLANVNMQQSVQITNADLCFFFRFGSFI